ncbi:MAG: response regulator [Bryobacteraceae bacterium]|jgi:CheY-like chemotaxis protein
MPRILLADDDVEQLALRKTLLEAVGYEIVVAACPVETLRQVERSGADLIIMDLRFPNASGKPDSREGLSLIRRIRKSGYQSPVAVLSGWPEDLYGQPEEEMVSRVMVKPVGMPVLLEMIEELTSASAPSRNLP